jgi:PemK-like, MazF-like toxin of type II toxin-antitoxin system
VLVLSNQRICESTASRVVLIAPLSSKTEIRVESDIFIKKSIRNSLHQNSRILLGHTQPVLKEELHQKIGELDREDWDFVKGKLVWILGLDD